VEAAISSTASASTPIASVSTASASNRTWTLTEPGLYLIYELADKHDYQNKQLTSCKPMVGVLNCLGMAKRGAEVQKG